MGTAELLLEFKEKKKKKKSANVLPKKWSN